MQGSWSIGELLLQQNGNDICLIFRQTALTLQDVLMITSLIN